MLASKRRFAPDSDKTAFIQCAPEMAQIDEALLFKGFLVLIKTFSDYGIEYNKEKWDKALPVEIGKENIATLTKFFELPQNIKLYKRLKKFLTNRKIEITLPEPPELSSIDHEFTIDTDVATIAVGSHDVISKLDESEDSDNWVEIVKKGKAILFSTGSDGYFQLRLKYLDDETQISKHLKNENLQFPIKIVDNMLGVSGIVSSNSPIVMFPSGNYSAIALFNKDKSVYTVFITPVDPKLKWKYKNEIPVLIGY